MLRQRIVLGATNACFLTFVLLGGTEAAPPGQEAPPATVNHTEVELVPQITSPVTGGLAFSPDGRFVVIGSSDTLQLWDVATGKLLRSFSSSTGHSSLHRSPGSFAAFSPDGQIVMSGGYGAIKLWDPATGRELRSIAPKNLGTGNVIAFSPDGRFAAYGGTVTLRNPTAEKEIITLWNLETGQQVRTFEGHSYPVTSVAFSPDGRLILSGSGKPKSGAEQTKAASGETMKLWDVATGKEVRGFPVEGEGVDAVAFSPDGRLALSGGRDQTMRLWDLATGTELRSFPGITGRTRFVSKITSVAFSPDGRFALSGNSYDKLMGADRRTGLTNAANTRLWDVNTGQEVRSFAVPSETITKVAGELWSNPTRAIFSPDGRFVLTNNGGSVRLSDVATGRELRRFRGHSSGVFAATVSPDGRWLLSQNGGTLKLWDLATGKQLRRFDHNLRGEAMTFSPDSRLIASAGHGGFENLGMSNVVAFSPDRRSILATDGWKVMLWDAATGERLRELGEARGPDNYSLILWDAQTGKAMRHFSGHSQRLMSLALSPDGRVAASSSRDKTMRLWEVATGKELRRFEFGTSSLDSPEVTFSADGGTVILAGVRGSELGAARTAVLWDVATGNQLRRVDLPHLSSTFSFSPDRSLLLMQGKDHVVSLFDMAKQKELHTFTGHKSFVEAIAFLPDRQHVISGSLDGTVRIWGLREKRELVRFMAGSDDAWLTLTPQGFFASAHRDTDMLGIVRGLEVTSIGQVHQSLFNPDLVREALAGDPDGEVREAAKVINLEKVLDSGPAPGVTVDPPGKRGEVTIDVVTVAARIEDRGKGVGRVEWRVNGITAAVAAKPEGRGPIYTLSRQLAVDPGDNAIEVVAYNGSNLLASPPARTTVKFTGPADQAKPKLHILAIGINAYEDRGWVPPGSNSARSFGPLGLAVRDATAFADSMKQSGAGLYGEVRVTLALDRDATRDNLDRLVNKVAADIHPRDSFMLFAAAHGAAENGRFYLIPQDYQNGPPGTLAQRAIGQTAMQDWLANRIKARKAIVLLDTCESGALIAGYRTSRIDTPASEAAVGRLHEATGRPVLTATAAGQAAGEGIIAGSREGHGYFTWAVLDALRHGDSNGNGLIELSELAAHVQSVVPKVAAGIVVRAAASEPTSGQQAARFGSRGEDFAVARRQ
jgi:WD40 repeat protein/uncharacterized caspase-like protein